MERTCEVRVYRTELICDACGVGFMKPTGTMIGGWPAKFPHQCTECNVINNYLTEQYPKITYKEVGNNQHEIPTTSAGRQVV